MATATSGVDAAVTNLIAAINTQPAILAASPFVQVVEGPPTLSMEDDLIVVAEHIQQMYQPHAVVGSGGSKWLIEEILISITVDVFRGGDNATTTRQRCETLVNAVDDAVRNDPTLGGAVYMAYPSLHQYSQTWDFDAKGRRCICAMEIMTRNLP
jgi:hypothetical protein